MKKIKGIAATYSALLLGPSDGKSAKGTRGKKRGANSPRGSQSAFGVLSTLENTGRTSGFADQVKRAQNKRPKMNMYARMKMAQAKELVHAGYQTAEYVQKRPEYAPKKPDAKIKSLRTRGEQDFYINPLDGKKYLPVLRGEVTKARETTARQSVRQAEVTAGMVTAIRGAEKIPYGTSDIWRAVVDNRPKEPRLTSEPCGPFSPWPRVQVIPIAERVIMERLLSAV